MDGTVLGIIDSIGLIRRINCWVMDEMEEPRGALSTRNLSVSRARKRGAPSTQIISRVAFENYDSFFRVVRGCLRATIKQKVKYLTDARIVA